MNPVLIASIVQAAASAIGSWWSTRRQEKFANKQSTTSYQRMVNDLELAGLNPMLAYQQGHGEGNLGITPSNPLQGLDLVSAQMVKQQVKTGQSAEAANWADVFMKGAQADNVIVDTNRKQFELQREKLIWDETFKQKILTVKREYDYLLQELEIVKSSAKRAAIEVQIAEKERELIELSLPEARFTSRQYEFLKDLKSDDWKDYIKYAVPYMLQGGSSAAGIWNKVRPWPDRRRKP